jgi:hypothetical protein
MPWLPLSQAHAAGAIGGRCVIYALLFEMLGFTLATT